MSKKRNELPRIDDRISFLYIEHAVIEQEHRSLVLVNKDGKISLPTSQFVCLLIGPGTSITHSAIKILADNECMAFWCGEEGNGIYSVGRPKTTKSHNLLKQAALCMDESAHMSVVRKMYEFRFKELFDSSVSLMQLRGIEGSRMKKIYQAMSDKYGVAWNGRNYKPGNFKASDQVNQFITLGNSFLYSICEACISALGYSSALGFIHTGRPLSFVYDIADLYKSEITIPAAFEAASEGIYKHSDFRTLFRDYVKKSNLLTTISDDISCILDVGQDDIPLNTDDAGLWSQGGCVVKSGVNYGDVSE